MNAKKMSRRETIQFSATALAGMSLAGLKPGAAAAQAGPQPEGLVDTQLEISRRCRSSPMSSRTRIATTCTAE